MPYSFVQTMEYASICAHKMCIFEKVNETVSTSMHASHHVYTEAAFNVKTDEEGTFWCIIWLN